MSYERPVVRRRGLLAASSAAVLRAWQGARMRAPARRNRKRDP
jgi:hypothetical protein